MHIAIICGYGLYDATLRTAKEMQGLDDYYFACFNDIKKHPKINTIILCGGYTNPADSTQSEAGSVFSRFVSKQRVIDPDDYTWILEDQSANAAQSVAFSIAKMLYSLHRVEKFIIYCDKLRKAKLRVFTWRILSPLTGRPFQIIGFKRQDIHPNSTWLKQSEQAVRAAVSPKYMRSLLMAKSIHTSAS